MGAVMIYTLLADDMAMRPEKIIRANDATYPERLHQRLGALAPEKLTLCGNPEILSLPRTAIFCSVRCPSHVIFSAYDQAARWRDAGRCIISGFHSPVEKECLRILLRGVSPVIVCPARTLPERLPPAWRKPLDAGRLLILSAFKGTAKRVTTRLAAQRNEFVAALADEVILAHATAGGRLEELTARLRPWKVPLITLP